MKSNAHIAIAVLLLAALSVSITGCTKEGETAGADPAPPEDAVMTEHDTNSGQNRLAGEKSPYLLQHADNPVDWYPWGDEAFDLAMREDKPIFLSIGYSTCHWCHVMEHESFEDEQVAALMNDAFVSVKVDREERPDIDNIYMSVCQLMTGKGGWPLTIVMTPSREPFYAGTYIPRDAMLNFIPRVKELWNTDRQRLISESDRILKALEQSISTTTGDELGLAELERAYDQFADRYDDTHGGFGSRPKFPTPHNLMFLLRYWKRSGDAHALEMVEHTLSRMRLGGMYDHVGFGFHRYSTDERWFLPHFEKMLYDQALLTMAYTEAYQATGKEEYRRVAEEIITYVLRDMTDPGGGFYSAEDADSEGEEGKFYLWSEEELRDVLGAEADLFVEVFGVTGAGNYAEEASGHSTRTNILYLDRPLSEMTSARSMGEARLRERLESSRRALFEVRETRIHPYKDDKILADWNGLMIAALAKAARAFDNDEYVRRARAAAEFVTTTMAAPDGGLQHRFRLGDVSFTGMIDDYAFVSWGLLELYETTFDTKYLKQAIAYTRYSIDHLWDDTVGGFFFTSELGEKLIVRQKEIYDGAVPSGNSVSMLNLIRIGRITADPSWEKRARELGRSFQVQVSRGPSSYSQMMTAVDFTLGPSFEIVIAGVAGADDTSRMARALEKKFIPRKVVLFRSDKNPMEIGELAPYTRTQSSIDGRATAYVCRNYACELPTSDIEQMMKMLSSP